MPIDLAIPSGATIVLWVEDSLTREYLRSLWGNSAGITFRLGGGNDGVRAIVKAFEEEGYPNVFGLTDRDFRPSNHEGWMTPSRTFRTFVLPVHEIENYLLDANALQASRYQNRRLDVTAIQARMNSAAERLCWWAACREVIAELKRRFREPFVADPGQSVVDHSTAREHICQSTWFLKLTDEATRSAVGDIHALLDAQHILARGRLADGSWRQDFAGKEILRDVAGWMCERPRDRPFPSDPVFFADLAKEVGTWQLAREMVPPDLSELLTALKARITPPPDRGQ